MRHPVSQESEGSNPFPCIIFTFNKGLNNEGVFISYGGMALIQKGQVVLIVLLFITTCIIPTTAQDIGNSSQSTLMGQWLYVGGSGPENYTKIQDAIDNASDSDTVYVHNGTYFENINITKPLTLMGEQQYTTIIDGCQRGNVITVESNNVTISGFTLKNGTDNTIWERWAIQIQKGIGPASHLKNISLAQCVITENRGGILFQNVIDGKIQNCTILDNSKVSIEIRHRSDNILIENTAIYHNGETISNNSFYSGGIRIDGNEYFCSNLALMNCKIYENIGIGLDLRGTHNISVAYCSINDTSFFGIYIAQKNQNIVIHHTKIIGNRYEGIHLIDGTTGRISLRTIRNILIHNNTIANNGGILHSYGGMFICNCVDGVRIIDNDIISNDGYGVYFDCSRKNQVVNNNFINNTCNAYFSHYGPARNQWKGNYWDTWIGIGPKMIKGYKWVNFDWRPAKNPMTSQG
jgi:parallel beta-helix repeat protein